MQARVERAAQRVEFDVASVAGVSTSTSRISSSCRARQERGYNRTRLAVHGGLGSATRIRVGPGAG